MNPRVAVRILALLIGGYFLYFDAADQRGLIGPDEPRYASIARAMAESGDWVTPRLDGEPWFEKPALLYWIGAFSNALGDHATRAPLAGLSFAFLALFHWRIRREFGETEADLAAVVLATSVGWVAFSQVGAFDLPLSVALGCALLALIRWVAEPQSQTPLYWFGASLGVAVLAKGLVGPAIAGFAVLTLAPIFGFARLARNFVGWRTLGPFLAVAAPWYLACYAANGSIFLDEFIWKHHVLRLVSPELDHVQPFWFYFPVLILFLAPWSALLLAPPVELMRQDPRARLLAGWAIVTLVLFSASTNKLPSYILPALPPLAALIGIGMVRKPASAILVAACGLILCSLPLAAAVLPEALAHGISTAWPPTQWSWVSAGLIACSAIGAGYLQATRKTSVAIALLTVTAIVGLASLKRTVFAEVDRLAGSRSAWRQVEHRLAEVCVGEVRRHVLYGLAYYSHGQLRSCDSDPRRLQVTGDPPEVAEKIFLRLP